MSDPVSVGKSDTVFEGDNKSGRESPASFIIPTVRFRARLLGAVDVGEAGNVVSKPFACSCANISFARTAVSKVVKVVVSRSGGGALLSNLRFLRSLRTMESPLRSFSSKLSSTPSVSSSGSDCWAFCRCILDSAIACLRFSIACFSSAALRFSA